MFAACQPLQPLSFEPLRYHLRVQRLAERLLRTIRKDALIHAGDRVAAAVSGGADSVALLRLLLELRSELGIVLSVVHVNHKMRGKESDEDEAFVGELARQNELELHCRTAPLAVHKSGIEAAARKLRYDVFRTLARDAVTKIATAHTLDDQAETVLLRAMRGAGLRGLAGIHPRLSLEEPGAPVVVRPLLSFCRDDLKSYLREQSQAWREDSSNRDPAFLRNRVRQQVVPVLQNVFGPGSVENLAALAEIARAEQEHWQAHPEVVAPEGALPVAALKGLSLAAQRQLVRNWLERNAPGTHRPFRLIEDLIELAAEEPGRKLEVSAELMVRRTHPEIRLEPVSATSVSDYEYSLPIPGCVAVAEINLRIEAVVIEAGGECENREPGLDPALLPGKLTIRNWRAGDRYWPANTKAEKKVKELLSVRRLTGVEKKMWPVAVAEGIGVVWVRGLAVPANLRAKAGGRVLWMREIPLGQTP